jgi:hypothetical protein
MEIEMNDTKKRQIHADLVIMQANDISLRFDWYDPLDSEWKIETEIPCQFISNFQYRLHERKFPETSLSDDELEHIGNVAIMNNMEDWYIFRQVANAAIKQYILDTEKESK